MQIPSTHPTVAPTLPEFTTTPSTVSTEPPTTAPPIPEAVQLTFGEDFSLLCRNYFIYQCGSDNLAAISGETDAQMYPASITKLFTAHVALQYLSPEMELTAGDELDLVLYGSSVANIGVGNVLTVAQLVEGMLLPSGNDAAYVLAAAAARIESGNHNMTGKNAVTYFVDMMNREAKDLGMTGTHFTNPDGYHNDNHYTTPADMITMAKLALENDLILACAAVCKDEVTFVSGQTTVWENTNLLMNPESEFYCPEAVGLKTGKTNRTGYCLLSAFQMEREYVIIGVFGCDEINGRFVDTLKLYEAMKDAVQ